jgi:predicted nucleic acid-binding protein
MTVKVPITFVIADTGPLITLAIADRLDLLQSFGTPVFVTDAVA